MHMHTHIYKQINLQIPIQKCAEWICGASACGAKQRAGPAPIIDQMIRLHAGDDAKLLESVKNVSAVTRLMVNVFYGQRYASSVFECACECMRGCKCVCDCARAREAICLCAFSRFHVCMPYIYLYTYLNAARVQLMSIKNMYVHVIYFLVFMLHMCVRACTRAVSACTLAVRLVV